MLAPCLFNQPHMQCADCVMCCRPPARQPARSGLAAALAVRPQVASAWQPAHLHLRHACSAKVLVATADRRVVSRPRVRQSAAPSRHQLLPACGACKWRVSAGRRCSDVAHSSPASASSVFDLEPRLRSSVSSTKRDSRARVAGGDGLRATCSCAGRYRSQLAPGARSIPVGMAAASAHQPQL